MNAANIALLSLFTILGFAIGVFSTRTATRRGLREYLDRAIVNWRVHRDKAWDAETRETAECYVDAFQSVRVSIFGSRLPPVLLCALLFAGCGPETDIPRKTLVVPSQDGTGRFVLEAVDRYSDGNAYNSTRTVYVLRDTETGREFVGVSGVGIAEIGSHSTGKNHTATDER
jgi:hypothetical protein